MEKTLTPRQKRFVDEYLVDLNATQAAIRSGYKEHTAKEQGYDLLTRTHIKAAVADRMRSREERTQVSQDLVVKRLAKFAFESIPLDEIKHSDVIKCLELLGKHLGMFEKEKINMTDEELIERARKIFLPDTKKKESDDRLENYN